MLSVFTSVHPLASTEESSPGKSVFPHRGDKMRVFLLLETINKAGHQCFLGAESSHRNHIISTWENHHLASAPFSRKTPKEYLLELQWLLQLISFNLVIANKRTAIGQMQMPFRCKVTIGVKGLLFPFTLLHSSFRFVIFNQLYTN